MFRIGGIAQSPDHVLAVLDPGSPQRRANRSGANDSDTHEYLLVSRESRASVCSASSKPRRQKWPSLAPASRSPVDFFARTAAMTDIRNFEYRERRSAGGGTAMEMRVFGRTGMRLSVLGFGCGAVGGLMVRGEPLDQERTVARAID